MKEYGFQLSVIEDVTKTMKSVQKSIDLSNKAIKDIAASLGGLSNDFDGVGRGAERGRQKTAGWLKETLSFNRALRQTTALVGMGFGLSSITSFTGDMIKAEQQVRNTFGVTGEELQALMGDVQRLATTYGVDMGEAITSAKTLSSKFGIEAKASMELISTAMSKGVGADFLSDIESMAPDLAAAGMAAEDMMGTLMVADRAGVKDEISGIFEEAKKSLDLLGTKKGGEASAALSAIGLNPQQLKKDLDSGAITVAQAVQKIAGSMDSVGIGSKKASDAMGTLFGKEGSKSMATAVNILSNATMELDEVSNRTTAASAAQQTLLGAWAEFKIYLAETILPIFANIVEWVKINQEAIMSWGGAILKVGGAVLGVWAAYKAGVALSAIITGMSTAWAFLTGTLNVAKGAQIAFNIAASLNPLGLVVAAIAAIGAAVYAVVAYWEDIKGWLWGIAEGLWKLNPLSWMGDAIEYVFPGFKAALSSWYDSITSYFGAAYDWLSTNFFEPFASAFDGWADWATGGLWSEAWAAYDELEAAYAEQNKMSQEDWQNAYKAMPWLGQATGQNKMSEEDWQNTYKTMPWLGQMFSSGKPSSQLGLKSGKGVGVAAGIAEVRGDARQMKNITINIDKLIDGFSVSTNTFGESKNRIAEEVTKALLMAVNDTNNI
jgi:hypothetical protein